MRARLGSAVPPLSVPTVQSISSHGISQLGLRRRSAPLGRVFCTEGKALQSPGGLHFVKSLKGYLAEVSSLRFSSSCPRSVDWSEVTAAVIVISGVFFSGTFHIEDNGVAYTDRSFDLAEDPTAILH